MTIREEHTAGGERAIRLNRPGVRRHWWPRVVDVLAVAVPGDSGSADGRAVGVLVTTGLNIGGLSGNAVEAGTIGITRLGPQLTRAQDVLNLRLHLEVAPLG